VSRVTRERRKKKEEKQEGDGEKIKYFFDLNFINHYESRFIKP
jgi:hypothetical protein